MRRHVGAGGVFVFVLLLLALTFIIALFTLSRTSTAIDEQAQTKSKLETAADALEQFAGSTGRLPCPARPDVDDGVAVPSTPPASVNCTYPQGVLPWATIGMRRDDAYDAWGWKISYRVYNGAGGMTQDQGASMVNCDTSPTLGSAGVDANKLCRSTHATLPSEFVAGKGLDVTDFGTSYLHTTNNGAAYVLISHGATGLGAYSAAGVQKNLPKSTDEKNNLTGPFVAKAASSPEIGSEDTSHFDDILAYRTLTDLATHANLAARNWPDNLTSLVFSASSVQAASGSASAPTAGSSLDVSTLQFYGANVSTGSGTLAFDSVGGYDGIGVLSGGADTTSISGVQSISVTFATTADKLGISLNDFGGSTFFGFFFPETAILRFFRNGSLLYTTSVSGCQNSIVGGGPMASFTLTPGVSFDQVQITPFFSSFFLSAARSCAATDPTCLTALDNGSAPPAGNHCSWP